MTSKTNSPLPWYTRAFFIIVVLLVVPVTLGMLFNPEKHGPGWFWPLKPFNVRFLGFFYLAEVSAVLVFIWKNNWSPGRLLLTGAVIFTGYATVVSAVYFNEFNQQTTWKIYSWFGVYGGSFLITAIFLFLFKDYETFTDVQLTTTRRYVLYAYTGLMAIHFIGLIAFPVEFSSTFWPWTLDVFNGRFYSAIALIMIYSIYYLLKGAHHMDYLAVGVVMMVFGLGTIVGLAVVDAEVHKISWSSFKTAFWLFTTASSAILGYGFIRQAWQAKRRGQNTISL